MWTSNDVLWKIVWRPAGDHPRGVSGYFGKITGNSSQIFQEKWKKNRILSWLPSYLVHFTKKIRWGVSPDNFRQNVIAEPHGISLAFMSIAIVVFGLGCWLHYSPVNRSLASRLHVARIPPLTVWPAASRRSGFKSNLNLIQMGIASHYMYVHWQSEKATFFLPASIW